MEDTITAHDDARPMFSSVLNPDHAHDAGNKTGNPQQTDVVGQGGASKQGLGPSSYSTCSSNGNRYRIMH